MEKRTFEVPNIGCDGCVRSIVNELTDIKGVESVNGEVTTKLVTVQYGAPATWEQIKEALTEINYAPAEALMP
jgi:copper chaperone CopZ